MGLTNRVVWEPLRSINSASLNGTYQAFGFSTTPLVPAPLLFPSYILKMVNNSNVLVTISIDGVTDIDVCPANSFWLYDEGKVGESANAPAVRAGTQIYVKGTVPGTDGLNIYLVSQYIVVG